MAEPGNVEILIDGPTWLTVRTTLTGVGPEDALIWFLDRDKVLAWWGQEADIDRAVGGRYEVRWPSVGYTLRGEIIDLRPTEAVISWWFLHEPELPARMVHIRTEANGTGDGDATRVTINHGPYRQSAAFPQEDEDRQSHVDGWSHYLPLLQRALTAAS